MAKHHSNPPPRPPKPPKSNPIRMSEPPMSELRASKEAEIETKLPPLQPRQAHQIPPPLPPLTQQVGTFAVFSGQHTHSLSPSLAQQSTQRDQTQTNTNRFQSTTTTTTTTLPITVPLTSTSFSRRRPPPPGSSLPIISSLTSSTLSNQSTNSQQLDTQISPVTLAAPRPETERFVNEYVETPIRTPKLVSRLQLAGVHSTHRESPNFSTHPTTHNNWNGDRMPIISGDKQTANTIASVTPGHLTDVKTQPFLGGRTANTTAEADCLNLGRARNSIIDFAIFQHEIRDSRHGDKAIRCTDIPAAMRANSNRCERVSNALPITAITKQPLPFSKETTTAGSHDDNDIHPANGEILNSITCPQCKRCRCEECQRPRQLPSRWVCDNTCLCSAETIIDNTSCMCCVKALFYHCSKDHEIECEGDSISCADDPCSCLPHKRTQRWAWLSALSLALPCLWFYWPMRGCVAICAKCYARHSRHGCRCPVQNLNKSTINNISSNNSGTNSTRTINRTGDLTPEKRLLDSSPEF